MAAKRKEKKIRLQSTASHYYRTAVKRTTAKVMAKGEKQSATVGADGKLKKQCYDPVVRRHVEFVEKKLAKAS